MDKIRILNWVVSLLCSWGGGGGEGDKKKYKNWKKPIIKKKIF